MEEKAEYKKNEVIMCNRCGERPAVLRKNGQVVNGLCGHCRQEIIREKGGQQNKIALVLNGVKKCKACGSEKPLSEFYTSRTVYDGYENSCKKCRSQYFKELKRNKYTQETAPIPRVARHFDGEIDDPFLSELGKLFAEYPEVMETLENTAKRDVRSVAEQAVYCIREGLATAD
uniref:Putative ribbon-helix-helix protein repressor n=1 Tax=viral metagenome TaxID=1070528 RepID=A0A6M3ITW6_9ZZZZ